MVRKLLRRCLQGWAALSTEQQTRLGHLERRLGALENRLDQLVARLEQVDARCKEWEGVEGYK